jgi:hypothetical protein
MAEHRTQGEALPPPRPGQCPTVKDDKRCGRPAGHHGLCDSGPALLSLDDLFGPELPAAVPPL